MYACYTHPKMYYDKVKFTNAYKSMMWCKQKKTFIHEDFKTKIKSHNKEGKKKYLNIVSITTIYNSFWKKIPDYLLNTHKTL